MVMKLSNRDCESPVYLCQHLDKLNRPLNVSCLLSINKCVLLLTRYM